MAILSQLITCQNAKKSGHFFHLGDYCIEISKNLCQEIREALTVKHCKGKEMEDDREIEMNLEAVYMVRSGRGQDLLCVDNFLYQCSNDASDACHWTCNNQNDKQNPCDARLETVPWEGYKGLRMISKVMGKHNHKRLNALEISTATRRQMEENAEIVSVKNEPKIKMSDNYLSVDETNGMNETKSHFEVTEEVEINVDHFKRDSFISNDKAFITEFHDSDDPMTIPEKIDVDKLYLLSKPNGDRMICFNGFFYTFKNTLKSKVIHLWQCIRRDEDCGARICTELLPNGSHKMKALPANVCKKHTHQPYSLSKTMALIAKCNLRHVKSCDPTIDTEQLTATKIKGTNVESYFKYCKNPDEVIGRKDVFTFLPSTKGNKVLCLNNQVYNYDSRSPRKGRSYWTCLLRRHSPVNCSARVTMEITKNGPFVVRLTGNHDHDDQIENIKHRLANMRRNQQSDGLKRSVDMPLKEHDDDYKRCKYDFKMIVAKTKAKIARRVQRLQMQKANKLATPVDSCSSSEAEFESFSDSDSNDDNGPEFVGLPTSLEEMKAKTVPTTQIKMQNSPKFEAVEIDPFGDIGPSARAPGMSALFKRQRSAKCKPLKVYGELKVLYMTTIGSPKGGHLLFVDGYIFNQKSITDSRVYWNCIKANKDECPCSARIITTIMEKDNNLNVLSTGSNHSHPWNASDIKKRLYSELRPIIGADKLKETKAILDERVEARYKGLMEEMEKARRMAGENEKRFQNETSLVGTENLDMSVFKDDDDSSDDDVSISGDGAIIWKMRMLRSAKGGDLLCVNGYIYHMRSVQNKRTYWSCIKSKMRDNPCLARLTTTLKDNRVKVVKFTNSHNHDVCESDIRRRLSNEFKNKQEYKSSADIESEVTKKCRKLLRGVRTTANASSSSQAKKDDGLDGSPTLME